MVDRYTKVVLTVIAVALLWLCLKEPMPVAEAKTKPTPTKGMTYMQPGVQGVVILGVATTQGVAEFKKTGNLPYVTTKGGVIPVSGSVDAWLNGPVDMSGPVEVTGTVEVDQPVRVDVDNWSEASSWLSR